jgi:hypothetical protein
MVVGLRHRCFFRSQLLARVATTVELGSLFYGRESEGESEGDNLGTRLAHDLRCTERPQEHPWLTQRMTEVGGAHWHIVVLKRNPFVVKPKTPT